LTTTTVPSETLPDVTYRVDLQNGVAVCTCWGYTRWGHCKHAKGVEGTMTDEERETAEKIERELVPVQATLPSLGELHVMRTLAGDFRGLIGTMLPKEIDSPAKALAVMEAGRELGAPPMVAFRHMFIIGGKVQADGEMMQAVVRRRDPTARFEISRSAEACHIILYRGGQKVVDLKYKITDVPKQLREGGRGPWQQYTEDMLFWYTMKRVCRSGAADLINAMGGIDVADAEDLIDMPEGEYRVLEETESGPVDTKTGEIVEGEAREVPADEPAAPEQRPDPLADLQEHLKKLGIKGADQLAGWLGYKVGTSFNTAWLVPARDAGMTDDRIVEVTIDALDRVAKALKGGSGKPARSLPEAVEYVAPRSLIGREMDDAKKAKAEAPAPASGDAEDVPFDQEAAPAAEGEAKQPELV
jgi:hypothetical protein